MPTVEASGTQTATGGEDSLSTISLNRSVVLVVDANNMVTGDVLILRLKRRVLSTGTNRTAYTDTFTGAQQASILNSVPLSSPHQTQATLQQSSGAGRQFPWSLESI